jgi:hypothetical protein
MTPDQLDMLLDYINMSVRNSIHFHKNGSVSPAALEDAELCKQALIASVKESPQYERRYIR